MAVVRWGIEQRAQRDGRGSSNANRSGWRHAYENSSTTASRDREAETRAAHAQPPSAIRNRFYHCFFFLTDTSIMTGDDTWMRNTETRISNVSFDINREDCGERAPRRARAVAENAPGRKSLLARAGKFGFAEVKTRTLFHRYCIIDHLYSVFAIF